MENTQINDVSSAKVIEVSDVTMRFRIANDRINSFKEFIVKSLRRQITYRDFYALKHVSFDVRRGEVVGLIGRNGAGKSTLLKVISGILKPTGGSAAVYGNVAPMLELGSGFDYDIAAFKPLLNSFKHLTGTYNINNLNKRWGSDAYRSADKSNICASQHCLTRNGITHFSC